MQKYVYVLADEMKGEMRMITTWKVTYMYEYNLFGRLEFESDK